MADTTLIRTSYNKDADIKIMWIEKIASEILNCIARINEGNEHSRAQMELKSALAINLRRAGMRNVGICEILGFSGVKVSTLLRNVEPWDKTHRATSTAAARNFRFPSIQSGLVCMSIFLNYYDLMLGPNDDRVDLCTIVMAWRKMCQTVIDCQICNFPGFSRNVISLGHCYEVSLLYASTATGVFADHKSGVQQYVIDTCPRCGALYLRPKTSGKGEDCCLCHVEETLQRSLRFLLKKSPSFRTRDIDLTIGRVLGTHVTPAGCFNVR